MKSPNRCTKSSVPIDAFNLEMNPSFEIKLVICTSFNLKVKSSESNSRKTFHDSMGTKKSDEIILTRRHMCTDPTENLTRFHQEFRSICFDLASQQ